jgi:hypothetical protein
LFELLLSSFCQECLALFIPSFIHTVLCYLSMSAGCY